MFKTHMGPVGRRQRRLPSARDRAGHVRRLRLVQATSRKKIPFGIAQIGKSFRNEITPGNFIFRMREFEQMELEFFVEPGTDEDWHEYWIEHAHAVVHRPRHARPSTSGCASTSPTSSATTRSGPSTSSTRSRSTDWGELEGVANRTDFDLKAHEEASGQDLSYFDQEKEMRYHPYVIEPAAGVDRALLAFLLDAYRRTRRPPRRARPRSERCCDCTRTWRR